MLVRKNMAGVIQAMGSRRTDRISLALRPVDFLLAFDEEAEGISWRRRRRATFFSRLLR